MILFIILIFAGVRVMRIRHRALFMIVFTPLFWLPFLGSLFFTSSIILGNQYFKSGHYEDAALNFLEFDQFRSTFPGTLFSQYLISDHQIKLFEERFLIALYHSKLYQRFSDRFNPDTIKGRPLVEQPFWMLYLADSYWHLEQKQAGKTLFFRSYLMALSVLNQKQLGYYETYLKTMSDFKRMVIR